MIIYNNSLSRSNATLTLMSTAAELPKQIECRVYFSRRLQKFPENAFIGRPFDPNLVHFAQSIPRFCDGCTLPLHQAYWHQLIMIRPLYVCRRTDAPYPDIHGHINRGLLRVAISPRFRPIYRSTPTGFRCHPRLSWQPLSS